MLHSLTRLGLAAALAAGLATAAVAEDANPEKAFLEANGTKDGVTTTDTGLQIRSLKDGEGRSPAATDEVVVHYTGTTIDGEIFDSSHKRGKPATFPLNAVISGWTEGLQLIQEGGSAQLVIPAELAYGTPPNCGHPELCGKTLIFDVELIEVK